LASDRFDFETIVHPQRDPGCFHRATDFLAGYRAHARQALIVLDCSWDGAPAKTGVQLERLLEESLRNMGRGDWARSVVIERS